MHKLLSPGSSRKFLFLSFLLPFLGYTVVMAVSQFSPFGSSSILYSDMYHQYFPFFVEFRRTLRAGESLLYNWNMGLGVDYLALIAYYLASPLNLLSVLVPESMLLGFFSMLVPVKLGLAGLFFGIFLWKIFRRADWSVPLFSGCYALCAWALGYQWNIMWLDTFALLPLVILGMVSLLRRRKFILYTLSLFFSIASNYYIGLFTCIFVGLCFICYEISYCRSIKRLLSDLGLMALFSALAIAMTAALEWPAYVALGNTNSSVNQFPQTFSLNIATENTWAGLWDGMRKVAGNAAGGISPTFKEGLPNLYCGILPLMLAIQFFTIKKIKIREKICCLFLLLLFMLSFIIRQLDYIWHGFHFTNMIPYRFSFLFSFVVLVMAYRAYLQRDSCPVWRVALSGFLFLGIAACSEHRAEPVFLVYNLVFFLIYITLMLLKRRPKKQIISTEDGAETITVPLTEEQLQHNRRLALLLLGALGLELACALVNFGVNFTGTIITNYPRGKQDAADVIAYMQEREENSPYYRAEFTHTQSLNDDALNGISGITMFSSSVNVRVTEFMAALGYGARPSYNRYSYEEASPVSDLFLNLKYLICRDGKVLDSDIYQTVYSMGQVYLLENTAYLPLGFLADPALANLSTDAGGSLTFQNQLFSAATGLTAPVYQEIEAYTVSTDSDETNVNQRGDSGYCTYTSGSGSSHVSIHFTVPQAGFVCLDFSVTKRNSLTIYKNGAEVLSESLNLDQMLAVGNCAAGDEIEVCFTCGANEDGRLDVTAAILDSAVFWQGVDILKQSPLTLENWGGTRAAGTITAQNDGLLYTSIPDDGNWVVMVDGEEAPVVQVLGARVGVELTAGEHTITFLYQNQAFTQGAIVSLAAGAVFAGISLAAYLPKKKGKFQG